MADVRTWRRTVAALFLAPIALVIFLVALTFAYQESASLRGNWAARHDLANGRYVVLGYGLPPASRPEYMRLLKTRYGIEFYAVAGCIVSSSLRDYVASYDKVSEAAAKKKFGSDVFDATWKEAENDWQTSHPKPAI